MKVILKCFHKYLILILICLVNYSVFPQRNISKEIYGQVTYLGQPLPDVNIIIVGRDIGVSTDSKGDYAIQVKVGEEIQYSYVGFNKVTILIEDVTEVLNIEMDAYVNELDEVVLTKKVEKAIDIYENMNIDLHTSIGTINPLKLGSSVHYLDNKSLSQIASPTLEDALNGRFSQVQKVKGVLLIRKVPAKYDIDGQIYERDPGVILSNIEHLFIIKNKALVIIRTKNSPEVIEVNRKKIVEQYTNKNYYNNDAIPLKSETGSASTYKSTPKKSTTIKQIKGNITYMNSPLRDVNVSIVGTQKGTKTDKRGNYLISADVGDKIQYSYVGFKTVTIIVEDITTELNIDMITNANKLDEVVVKSQINSRTVLERAKKADKKFNSSMGEFDPKKAGYAISYIDGEEIKPIYESLAEALNGKVAGVRIDPITKKLIVKPATSMFTAQPALWDVDGGLFTEEPPLDLNNIKDIHILKTLAGTNRYGSRGAGGVIVVRTKYGNFNPSNSKLNKITAQYTNKNYYSDDASAINSEATTSASVLRLQNFNNKEDAYGYYKDSLKNNLENYAELVNIAQQFIGYYDDTNLASHVLYDLATKFDKNPEVLKAIAYQFQGLGLKKEAIKMYEDIFRLRVKYAESYRDLANAYRENDQYNKAWKLYMSYLFKSNDISDNGLGQLLYTEMEWLYFNRKNQALIKEKFIPKNESINDFRNDVRIVFEWNTSEAEFELEFVNPQRQVYTFEHSLEKNQELITDEKTKGYSCKEFFIDELGEGEWLVNLTYLGNKKPEPTYFKITQYFNWGKPSQTQEISVHKLDKEDIKLQLIKLNKNLLAAKN
jgi:tetratricopeptide (TPR) repeat protein